MKKVLLLFLIVILVGCSKKKPYEVIQKDGIKYIKNTGQPSDESFDIELKHKFSIPFLDEDIVDKSRDMRSPTGIETDKDGNIFVYEYFNTSIKKFDSNGKFLKSFCQKGNGPGECIRISYVQVIDSSLYVFAQISKRVLKFDLDGNFIEFINLGTDYPIEVKDVDNQTLIIQNWNITSDEEKKDKLSIKTTLAFNNTKFNNKKDLLEMNTLRPMDNISIMDTKLFFDCSSKNIFLGEISEDSFKIEMYNKNFKKKCEISKRYRKVLMTSRQKEVMGNFITLDKKSEVKEKYCKAILGLWIDNKDRLWTVTARERDKTDKKIKFDIFKDGIYINSLSFNDFEDETQLFLWDRIFFKGKYIYFIDFKENGGEIKIFDY